MKECGLTVEAVSFNTSESPWRVSDAETRSYVVMIRTKARPGTDAPLKFSRFPGPEPPRTSIHTTAYSHRSASLGEAQIVWFCHYSVVPRAQDAGC